MTKYRHTKGQIQDNALEALLHDPLFRQRVEKILKVKAVIGVKKNMQKVGVGRPVVKYQQIIYHWPSGF